MIRSSSQGNQTYGIQTRSGQIIKATSLITLKYGTVKKSIPISKYTLNVTQTQNMTTKDPKI